MPHGPCATLYTQGVPPQGLTSQTLNQFPCALVARTASSLGAEPSIMSGSVDVCPSLQAHVLFSSTNSSSCFQMVLRRPLLELLHMASLENKADSVTCMHLFDAYVCTTHMCVDQESAKSHQKGQHQKKSDIAKRHTISNLKILQLHVCGSRQ